MLTVKRESGWDIMKGVGATLAGSFGAGAVIGTISLVVAKSANVRNGVLIGSLASAAFLGIEKYFLKRQRFGKEEAVDMVCFAGILALGVSELYVNAVGGLDCMEELVLNVSEIAVPVVIAAGRMVANQWRKKESLL